MNRPTLLQFFTVYKKEMEKNPNYVDEMLSTKDTKIIVADTPTGDLYYVSPTKEELDQIFVTLKVFFPDDITATWVRADYWAAPDTVFAISAEDAHGLHFDLELDLGLEIYESDPILEPVRSDIAQMDTCMNNIREHIESLDQVEPNEMLADFFDLLVDMQEQITEVQENQGWI